jgi:8-oxo-dGTP pyrophosphatase MutT (NUDIX family)
LLLVFRRLPPFLRRRIVRVMTPSFTVGAICLIERPDGKVLLVQQVYRTAWGVPGGLSKRGEDIAACAKREVLEEVGLEVDLVGEPAVVVDAGPQRVDVVYRARPASTCPMYAPGRRRSGRSAGSPSMSCPSCSTRRSAPSPP